MPVHIDASSVITRKAVIERLLEGGLDDFHQLIPGGLYYGDDCLMLVGFMSEVDAEEFATKLELHGFSRADETPDFVIVQAHIKAVRPECEWLSLFEYKGMLIGRMKGDESTKLIAHESWDDSKSALQHLSAEEVKEKLEFVRREDKVDVYRDRETGKLLYSARLHETDDELYKRACDLVWKHSRAPGGPPVGDDGAVEVREAIGLLQKLIVSLPEAWGPPLMLGKAWYAIDELNRSIDALKRADEIEASPLILKELAGIQLEMQQFDDACRTGERAVAIEPDDSTLLCNLAVAYVLNKEIGKAKKAATRAIAIDANDQVSKLVGQRIDELIRGQIEQPTSIAELSSPRKKGFLKRMFGKK